MKTQVLFENFQPSPHYHALVANLVDKKLASYLQSFDPDLRVADIHLIKRPDWGFQVNFSMVLPGKQQIFADARADRLEDALRAMRKKVERQLKEYRGRIGINQK